MKHFCNIGVRAHDLGELSTEEIIAFCKKNRVDGLQLVMNKTWPDLYEKRDKVAIMNQINELLENGIEIYLLGCYFNPIHSNAEFLDSEISRVLFVNEIAQEMKLNFIGSETGSVNDDAWTYNEKNHTSESLEKVISTFSEIGNSINDVKFLIEPVYDHVVYNIERQEQILDRLGSKFLTTLDLSNILNPTNYREYEKIFSDAVLSQKENIKLLHFKNFNVVGNAKVACPLQDGIIDYRKIINILEENELLHIPIIVEELEGEELINSIEFLRL